MLSCVFYILCYAQELNAIFALCVIVVVLSAIGFIVMSKNRAVERTKERQTEGVISVCLFVCLFVCFQFRYVVGMIWVPA